MPRECRTFSAINPAAQWGWLENFANETNYLLKLKLWQDTPVSKGKKAAHQAAKPKPFIPEFMKAHLPKSQIMEGVEPMTVDDVKSWLGNERGV